MEAPIFGSSKRIKTSKSENQEKDISFNFQVFFGDIQEKGKPLRKRNCRDFSTLFTANQTSSKSTSKSTQPQSVLFLTFAASHELCNPLIKLKIPIVLASDCSSNIEESIIQHDEKKPNFIRFFPKKKFFTF